MNLIDNNVSYIDMVCTLVLMEVIHLNKRSFATGLLEVDNIKSLYEVPDRPLIIYIHLNC